MHPDNDIITADHKNVVPAQPVSPALDPHRQRKEIEHRFTYHAPKTDQPERHVQIREKAKELGLLIHEATPESREQSLALTNLEQTVFWANAAIARRE